MSDFDWVVFESDVVIMVIFGIGLFFDVVVFKEGIYLNCVGVDICGKCEFLVGVFECVKVVVDDLE